MSADDSSVSFELARFEWVDPTRLEVEGAWNGVSRLRARATLVIEVDGRRRRLRALAGDAGTPEKWSAAFGWDGDDIPRLQGAELEVGRGIVVDLPRPRSSKARAQLPQEPIPATTRDDKDAGPGRAEAERIIAALDSARAEAEEARETLTRVRAERDELRAARRRPTTLRANAAELDALRGPGGQPRRCRRGGGACRARAPRPTSSARGRRTADSLAGPARRSSGAPRRGGRVPPGARPGGAPAPGGGRGRAPLRAEGLRSEYQDLLDERDALREEAQVLRARAAEADGLRDQLNEAASKGVAPDVARLRAELGNVERERSELRAQLDSTAQRLEEAPQAMAPLSRADGEPRCGRVGSPRPRSGPRKRAAAEPTDQASPTRSPTGSAP